MLLVLAGVWSVSTPSRGGMRRGALLELTGDPGAATASLVLDLQQLADDHGTQLVRSLPPPHSHTDLRRPV
ncbi:MAG TPA: hypothetical protein VG963_21125, partial [Polyangiaceae bacterium]|nr:hypothetical protein [Polyangiaceae bacterium]